MDEMPRLADRGEMTSGGGGRGQMVDPGLFYDDEPLDRILYGAGSGGPTPASLFAGAAGHLDAFRNACASGDMRAVMDAAAALGGNREPVSVGMCFEIASLMTHIVPQVPEPVLPSDLSPLQPLLEMIWRIARDRKHQCLQKQTGVPLFRWYEHHGRYAEARGVLKRMIEIHVREGDRFSEAIATNNLAFEYYLEGRFGEAVPGFQAAAALFSTLGNAAQEANALSNSWMCRMVSGDPADASQAKGELQRHAETLGQAGCWHVRKPLVMLAKIAESEGDLEHAVELVKRAIEACAGSNTRYPELDAEYLRHLQAEHGRIHMPGPKDLLV